METMKDLFRDALQQVMEGELEELLGYEKSERMCETEETGLSKNYRNGYSHESVKTQLGKVSIKIPRDRNGEYEPKIIIKYDRNADGMEEKILGLYACGMSQRDIAEQIKSLYDVEISGVHSCGRAYRRIAPGEPQTRTKAILTPCQKPLF